MVDPSTKVIRKVEKCGKELKMWNRDHFGNVRKELAKKRRFLVDGEKEAMRSGSNHRVRELKMEIIELIDKENRLWFQWAKVLWAKDGDKIPNSLTVEPLKERGKIQYRRFELHLVIGLQILKK